MKVAFVELCGFRGVRDKLRVDFPDGFVVLVGRNGSGKSTIIDAIDFALTGTINRFQVTDAKGGGLDQHIWWMGRGVADAHYVSVGFVAPDGTTFSISRDRDSEPSEPLAEIASRLCLTGPAASPNIETLVKTSIIRDELIAALSVDLPEQARFAAVRAAIGAIAGPDYSQRTGAVLAAANALRSEQEKEVDRIQNELGRALRALTEARSSAEKAADLSEALQVVESIPGLAGGATEKVEGVRSWAAARRRALVDVERARAQAEKLLPLMSHLDGPQHAPELVTVEGALADAIQRQQQARERLATAESLATAERRTDEYAAHLSALVEHGAALGLNHGHCPLCDAARTNEEFLTALDSARERLAEQGQRLRDSEAAVAEAARIAASTEEVVADLTMRVRDLRTRQAAIESEIAQVRKTYSDYGFDAAVDAPEAMQQLLFNAQEHLARVERAAFVLEASSSIDRVKTLEARISALKEQSEEAAAKLSDTERAVETARQIDVSGKTVANQMLGEQFDTVMPLLKELYRRLRPHPDWLEIEADFGGKVRASLNFVVGEGGNPQFLFSSGQRRAAGLAFLLAIHLSRAWCKWNTLVLDDPVQHVDDYRALNLTEVLAAIRRTGRQIIVAVEDVALADVLCRRLRSSTGDSGRRIDLWMSTSGTTEIANTLDIAPLPSHALQEAKAS